MQRFIAICGVSGSLPTPMQGVEIEEPHVKYMVLCPYSQTEYWPKVTVITRANIDREV